MLKKITVSLLLLVVLMALWWGYSSIPDSYDPVRDYTDIQDKMLTEFIIAEDSTTIELPEGHFIFSKSLALDGKKNITIRGNGIDKTVLSFKNQREGAEGIRITNGIDILLEDFTVEDAAGDNIKVMDTEGITFRRVKAAWTGAVNTENGAYGLYPVLCTDVLIEECEVLGSSDAGIYVGQSEKVVIRNNKAYMNVAGIESENSSDVVIYGNEAFDNTGGILVFNLPGLTMYGKDIRVYDNLVYNNNRKNFGMKGSIVSNIPAGTGMLILATNGVEVFRNDINKHKTIGIGIISYDLVYNMEKDIDAAPVDAYGGVRTINADYKNDVNYDGYPGRIHLYKNTYKKGYVLPRFTSDFGKIYLFKNGMTIPDVVYDGIKPAEDSKSNSEYYKICIKDEGIDFLELDAGNKFAGITNDLTSYRCTDISSR